MPSLTLAENLSTRFWLKVNKNRRQRKSSFVEIDLRDRIPVSGYITLREGREQVYVGIPLMGIEVRELKKLLEMAKNE